MIYKIVLFLMPVLFGLTAGMYQFAVNLDGYYVGIGILLLVFLNYIQVRIFSWCYKIIRGGYDSK